VPKRTKDRYNQLPGFGIGSRLENRWHMVIGYARSLHRNNFVKGYEEGMKEACNRIQFDSRGWATSGVGDVFPECLYGECSKGLWVYEQNTHAPLAT
jgi:hypothetical protein